MTDVPTKILTPELQAEISRDYVISGDIDAVCTRHNVARTAFFRLRREGRLDTVRAVYLAKLRKKAIEGEMKAREKLAYDEAYQEKISSSKQVMIELLADLQQIWLERRFDGDFVPKSPEGMANAMQKVADTISRINDAGDLKPQAIEINITGTNPQLPPPRDAVTVEVIESTGRSDCTDAEPQKQIEGAPTE